MKSTHRVTRSITPTRRLAVVGFTAFALMAGACGTDGSSDTPASTADGATDGSDTASAPAEDAEVAVDETTETTEAAEDTSTRTTPTTTTTAAVEIPETTEAAPPAVTMTILVTNDDGYATEGIDSIVQALLALPDTEITVVAPLENQSGSADVVSPDEEGERPFSDVETASGFPAIAVDGTPGDAVVWALANVFADEAPDLIVSGSNDGENIGPLTAVSGTVGAARIGARQGIPGLAISQGGISVEAEWSNGIGAGHATDWIIANREAILASEATPAEVWSINVPSCAGTGEVRGYLEVPLAEAFDEAAGEQPFAVNCTSELTDPDDDTTAFLNGYATLTQMPEQLVLGSE